MPRFLWYLGFLMTVLIQVTLIPVNFVLVWVVLVAALRAQTEVWVLAFGGGLVFDLCRDGRLGVSSIIFLVLSGLIVLYRKRFSPGHPIFLTIFVVVGQALMTWLIPLPVKLLEFGFLIATVFVIRKFIVFVFGWDNFPLNTYRKPIQL